MDDRRAARGGSAVPITAIVAGAIVGVVSPVAVAAVARRSRRELDASAKRQRAALDAEHVRLQTTLQAEGLRWRREIERALLDQGTVLISEFREVVVDIKLDQRGRPIVTDRWRATMHAIAAFRGRLLMWFEADSEVVTAYDAVSTFASWSTTWAGELRAGERKVRLTRPSPGAADSLNGGARTIEELDVAHLRYVVASRAFLSS